MVPLIFPTSWTFPLLISKMKGFLHSMLVFHVITPVILYIPISQKIEGEREREREIGFGFRSIWSKPLNNIVKAWYSASTTFEVSKRYV